MKFNRLDRNLYEKLIQDTDDESLKTEQIYKAAAINMRLILTVGQKMYKTLNTTNSSGNMLTREQIREIFGDTRDYGNFLQNGM